MPRPQRTTRGKRMNELMGEDAEKDEEFWNHDTWNESESDSGYSTESDRPDQFDSDFNESESEEDEEDETNEKEVQKREKKRAKSHAKQKSVYKEPAPVRKPKPTHPKVSTSQPRPRRTVALCPLEATRTLRATTAAKSQTSEALREAEKPQKRVRHIRPAKYQFAQEELLTEATATEMENHRWILTMQRAAREREESAALGNRGPKSKVKFQSKRGRPVTITFTEVEAQPDFMRRDLHQSMPDRPLCAITGLPAKYRDPLTKKFYATVEAFKKIRSDHARPSNQEQRPNKRSATPPSVETENPSKKKKQRKKKAVVPAIGSGDVLIEPSQQLVPPLSSVANAQPVQQQQSQLGMPQQHSVEAQPFYPQQQLQQPSIQPPYPQQQQHQQPPQLFSHPQEQAPMPQQFNQVPGAPSQFASMPQQQFMPGPQQQQQQQQASLNYHSVNETATAQPWTQPPPAHAQALLQQVRTAQSLLSQLPAANSQSYSAQAAAAMQSTFSQDPTQNSYTSQVPNTRPPGSSHQPPAPGP